MGCSSSQQNTQNPKKGGNKRAGSKTDAGRMYQDWLEWYNGLSEQLKSDVRTSEQRFISDEEFRNSFIGEFNQTFQTADADGDQLLNKQEFVNFQNTWTDVAKAKGAPKNWDTDPTKTKLWWYDYFNAETPGTDGVSAKDIMTGTMKYTEKIRQFLGMGPVAALIVVDVQNDFCTGGSLCVPENEAIFPVIERLRTDEAYCALYQHVFFTRDWHPQDHCSFQSNNPGSNLFETITLQDTGVEQVMWPDHCVQGSTGAEFHAQCQPKEADIVVSKGLNSRVDSYSGFGQAPEVTTLLDELKAKNVSKLYVVGLAYDFCVGSTACDGAANGFQTFLVTDATKSVKEDSTVQMDKRIQDAGVVKITHLEMLD